VGRKGSPPRQQVAHEEKRQTARPSSNHFMVSSVRHFDDEINVILTAEADDLGGGDQ
jgi:hypothetical protein